ncbi:MAG: 2Fe-2S iron-sulfur cluster-binding protein [Thermoleophilia bacterium]|nr:2Fe-2S iron-sulfur cluster-binding protein [Thermoleophilia bacterium]
MSEVARLTIFRFDPEHQVPSYRDYVVPLVENLTVIRSLFWLAEQADDPPAFRRYMCNRGQCASCVMTIDGRTRRACTTKVRAGMVLEPLHDYPVVRDLVVDFGRRVADSACGYHTIREGAFVLPSTGGGTGNLMGPWLFMKVDQTVCLTCSPKPCVRACWVNQIGNLEDRRGRRVPPWSAPIRIERGRAVLSGVCGTCTDAPCRDKCPVGAFRLTAGGVGYGINPRRCIGCGLCVAACRSENIWLNLERGHAVKCDLCAGQPACVKACPYGAISYEVITKEGLTRRSPDDGSDAAS